MATRPPLVPGAPAAARTPRRPWRPPRPGATARSTGSASSVAARAPPRTPDQLDLGFARDLDEDDEIDRLGMIVGYDRLEEALATHQIDPDGVAPAFAGAGAGLAHGGLFPREQTSAATDPQIRVRAPPR